MYLVETAGAGVGRWKRISGGDSIEWHCCFSRQTTKAKVLNNWAMPLDGVTPKDFLHLSRYPSG
jgi:hypothetical protein